MNYLSGGKKSILGTRLSSRYLSSDAFTSSAGKTGGRSISQLGSLFGRKNTSRRYSGTGQHIGLFELKNILFKGIIVLMCFIVLGYTVPFLRYGVHGFFTQTFTSVNESELDVDGDILQANEHYVSPVFGSTDRFVIKTGESVYADGSLVYAPGENVLLGVYVQASSSKPEVILLSEVGQRSNMFVKAVIRDAVTVPDTTATTSDEAASSSSEEVQSQKPVAGFATVAFEGFGYGQLRAQVPPQEELELNTILYVRTANGLVPAARVSYLEKDNGSTFTNIYAQLLVPPFELYKVRIGDLQN